MDHYQDKTAIVTGGASGIGRALCELLGRRGARVVVADINEAGAETVAAGIRDAGGRAEGRALDVVQAEAVIALVRDTATAHGRLDFMFNNAGIAIGGDYRDLELEHWRRVIEVNLWGVIHGIHAAYPLMVAQGSGHIVNTASVAGLLAVPIEIPYATSKHAVVGLSTSLRVEAEDLGVKVTVVCPGFIRTGIFDAAVAVNVDKERAMQSLPQRMPSAPDAARVILRGVERNREKIVFPFEYRVLWWLERLNPRLLAPVGRRILKDFRAVRG